MATRKLTAKEKEVFLRLIKGWSNKQIGIDMKIDYRTVSAHLQNIYPKLGVTNRYEVIASYQNPDDYENV